MSGGKPQKSEVGQLPIVDWQDDMPVCNRFRDSPSDSVFRDDSWSLHNAAGKVTTEKRTAAFGRVPGCWKDTVKRLAWCMLNIDAPLDLIQRPNAARSRLTPGSVVTNLEAEVRPFIRWLDDRQISALSDVTEAVLRAYADEIATSKLSRNCKARRLWGPTRFWLYAPYLPHADRLIQPPWELEGTQDLLGPANWSSENKTAPVHPQTMSLTLTWALAVVSDFSGSIIESVELRDRNPLMIKQSEQGDESKLARFFDAFETQWGGIPGVQHRGKLRPASQFSSRMTGVEIERVRQYEKARIKAGSKIFCGSPLIAGPLLFLNGKALRQFIDYYEVTQLKHILATASVIVIAYLSGMRSEECRGLQRGCCRRTANKDGSVRYEIVAKSYKDALDADGNAVHGGEIREEPWHVIEPVVRAVASLEALHTEEYLFAETVFRIQNCDDRGLVLKGVELNKLIGRFITWCNQESGRMGFPELRIPDDPAGPITMRRFRRTLAWFIYRLPAGRISLGIQYGHLQGMTSDGYGSRTSTGVRDLFPMEEAFARAELLAEAAERLDEGEFVSGPAADRYIAGVQEFSHRFQGKYLTVRQAAELRRDPTFRIFDNGMQPVACCYDSLKALCHPDREKKADAEATPNLSRCDPRCPNVARTDTHIDGVRKEIEWQELQAHSPLTPEPLRLRHEQRIATLNATVEKHESERAGKVTSDA